MPFEIGQVVRKTSDGFLVKSGEICTVLKYRIGEFGGCTMLVEVVGSGHEYWVNPDCCELVCVNNEDIDSFMSDFE